MMVFQFPCGTFWTSRSPCGAPGQRRVIVVETLVSSMKTSRLGSSLGCCFCRALRAAATSGRSCSVARRLFFKGQLQMMQKPGDRRLADRYLLLRQSGLKLRQRDIRLFRHQLPDQILVRCQNELLVATELGRADATRPAVKSQKAHDRADAHATLLRSFRYGRAVLNRADYACTQVLRIGLRYPCWPPPSRKLESYSCPQGNPPPIQPSRETLWEFDPTSVV